MRHPTEKQLAALRKRLAVWDAQIKSAEAELNALHVGRGDAWHRLVKAQYGIGIGTRVVTTKNTMRSGNLTREYSVCGISSEPGSGGRPWLTGFLVAKDGSVTGVRHPLYEGWRLKVAE